MIYTIALNPALDRTFRVKKIQYDDSSRIEKEQRYAGGKGIDVSRELRLYWFPWGPRGFSWWRKRKDMLHLLQR